MQTRQINELPAFRSVVDVPEELLSLFECNSPKTDLAFFLKDGIASEYHRTGEAFTNVMIDQYSNQIIGYYTLRTRSIITEDDVIPAAEIVRLAVCQDYQGQKFSCPEKGYTDKRYSDYLLDYAMMEIYNVRDWYIGISAVVLFSVPKAINFYIRNNFSFFPSGYDSHHDPEEKTLPMYLFLTPREG